MLQSRVYSDLKAAISNIRFPTSTCLIKGNLSTYGMFVELIRQDTPQALDMIRKWSGKRYILYAEPVGIVFSSIEKVFDSERYLKIGHRAFPVIFHFFIMKLTVGHRRGSWSLAKMFARLLIQYGVG